MRQVFLDTETTGLDVARGDRLVEIGCVEVIDRMPTGRVLHLYVNPERPSDPDALRVHGLTARFLSDKPVFAEVAQEVVDFLAGADVVAHNASFDVTFVDLELRRLGLAPLARTAARITDSLALARALFAGKTNSLDALCRRFDIDLSSRVKHGALLDAELLAKAWLSMTRGQHDLLAGAASPGAGFNADADAAGADFSRYDLVVLEPTADELAAHARLLTGIAAECKVEPLWQQASTPARRARPS